ncbi:metallophosphoesterase [Roseicyclus sp. F158]|uniref:Metallophosphoesterase n=1 Tax=Tropicimonas omnivorans TaxID=3075590 RepID=A0ABU3DDN5_9RHOB|nr:metallophosphoesterase [Roseicyclus sp. F158]MDT0681644.1 metallophosphoesterase [Roseicyclus sp. F158]
MTRRVVHLSDLHFGRDNPELLDPLVEMVNGLSPDLVAISGDFTQRARISQYKEAAAFLDRLDHPWLAVPGNHDTPLDNLFVRFFRPWRRYRAHVTRDMEPRFSDEEMIVAGVNTVNPYSWQRGRIRQKAVQRVCDAFDGRHGERMRIAVLHHPLEQGPDVDKAPTRGADSAVASFGACGADIVLSGHLHSWRAEPFEGAAGVLLVQAGTSLSTRLRDEPNDFNLLTFDGPDLEVARYTAPQGKHVFDRAASRAYSRTESGWRAA